MTLKQRLHNILYLSIGEKFNPLVWVFMSITLAWGVAFVFFPTSGSVSDTMIFQLTLEYLPSWIGNMWGWGLLVTVASTLYSLACRELDVAQYPAMAGFILWLYAFVLYASKAMLLSATTVAFPSMMFWAYFYLTIMRFRREYEDEEKFLPLGY